MRNEADVMAATLEHLLPRGRLSGRHCPASRLVAMLAGSDPDAPELQPLRDHLRACARCRAVAEALREDAPVTDVRVPPMPDAAVRAARAGRERLAGARAEAPLRLAASRARSRKEGPPAPAVGKKVSKKRPSGKNR